MSTFEAPISQLSKIGNTRLIAMGGIALPNEPMPQRAVL